MYFSITYNNVTKNYSAAGNYVLTTNGLLCDDNISIITNGTKLKSSYGGNVIFNAGTDGTIVFPVKNKTMTSNVVLNVTPLHVDIMLDRFQYSLGFNKSNAITSITYI